jgi:hypothetical protein
MTDLWTTVRDPVVHGYHWLDQWRVTPWALIAVTLIYLVAFWDLRRSKKRDGSMGARKFTKHEGPKVEYLIYKALQEAKLKEEISDKTYYFWAKYFAWHGFEKFKTHRKIVAGSPRATRFKEKILGRLGGDDKPVKLPG